MSVLRRLLRRLRDALEPLAPVVAPVGRVLSPVTSLGWTVTVIGLAAWWAGARLDWEELLILAGACLIALVIAVLWTIGRLALDIDVAVSPNRVVVGDDAVGSVVASNRRGRVTLGSRIEVPVGRGVATFDVGALHGDDRFEEAFVVPTNRRSVVRIGPARSVKGDPLGIARREVVSGSEVDLYVHPRTEVLPPLTAGWMRDLEGRTTNDLSTSDVAFHTLREYTPGDDRRHIHWRTTARLGTLMVRQFVDTRRARVGLVLSTDATDWASDDEFELGVSILGSFGRTALVDDQEVVTLTGARPIGSETPDMLLDALAGVERAVDGHALKELVRRSLRFTRGVSLLVLLVGSTVDPSVVRRACQFYDNDVVVLAVRCRLGAEVSRTKIANVSVVEAGRLGDLSRVLAVVGAG